MNELIINAKNQSRRVRRPQRHLGARASSTVVRRVFVCHDRWILDFWIFEFNDLLLVSLVWVVFYLGAVLERFIESVGWLV